ncbi:deazaflavin-dependent nitroreductase [Streptomyces agglomeratus]|uniref:Deazaflavin-dependent nitroreductase n=1 Tax=Streptomyces agglomeratus TaxID=285458 RepID=A0A1E5PA48_9ACTN|nr:nitroreductase family deazaflavin-dependent oxidoreductase [Streptomyces agglomeratus]OEJ26398.1 deazaflavin-dependent nitroreductase [Streptomyces agglomeratus]OEJ39539.1 deazaflavin-dependent nitroreductase [Streptomyces agglomeratus]OEJ46076.1 deazaflavin-dependent nitroreductase [Streptomyces agglomeratus]OEJ52104.1 deazaflavin-dependent nitroreductase [Streptomyces agglomeratus]OEJ59460.1 deazaflavin-dependent nitroreductase [Streptomyces agglomeratus]
MAPGIRIMQKLSSTRAFARVAPHFVPAVDRAVHRLTRGRVLLSAWMLPGVILTAKGARSGLPRTTPLACMPEEASGGSGGGRGGGKACDSWILIGSNFGRAGHPAWTANLMKHPDARISWRGEGIEVTARLLKGAERAAAWQAVLKFWPPYATYQARVEREIRLFRLEERRSR